MPRSATSAMLRSAMRTANTSGLSRLPLHVSQGRNVIISSMTWRMYSLDVSR